MPFGPKARAPTTKYLLYEYSFNSRVFYVGIGHSFLRAMGRAGHVRNLMKLEQGDALSESKRRDLYRVSNQVIATLISMGREHDVRIVKSYVGRAAALSAEKRAIARRLKQGCRLANRHHNPTLPSVAQVLSYLRVVRRMQKQS